jgi:hypothetical protein
MLFLLLFQKLLIVEQRACTADQNKSPPIAQINCAAAAPGGKIALSMGINAMNIVVHSEQGWLPARTANKQQLEYSFAREKRQTERFEMSADVLKSQAGVKTRSAICTQVS